MTWQLTWTEAEALSEVLRQFFNISFSCSVGEDGLH